MGLSLPQVEQLAVRSGKIDAFALKEAVAAARHLSLPLEDVLVGRRLLRVEEMGQLLAAAYATEYVNFRGREIKKEIRELVDEEFALKRRVLAYRLDQQTLWLAMEDPTNLETIELVKKRTGYEVKPAYTDKSGLQTALKGYKKTLKEEFNELVADGRVGQSVGAVPLSELAKDVSIVKAVATLLEFAIIEEASDIHLEPLADAVIVRYRIDGILHDVLTLPLELLPALVARIKILSSLKLDETRLPQDGRLQFESDEGKKISLRVSVLPTVIGEKVVLRVLEEALQYFSLFDLGLDKDQEGLVHRAIKKPYGLILVTGPTGSGKTTTLYTVLGLLNTADVNICTVEDPVENRIRRVNQTQVNPVAGYTFANGLRSLLRQDPDIIMVGEIRDKETARVAVNAAMTGHLVLSTLHTNDAPGAIPRLIDLETEPFLLASTLEMIIAQRLVRLVCDACRDIRPVDNNRLNDLINRFGGVKLRQESFGRGCPKCHFSGFRGRGGIFELLPVTEPIRELIVVKAGAPKIRQAALTAGMASMVADGLKKVAQGMTTVDEVLRVCLE